MWGRKHALAKKGAVDSNVDRLELLEELTSAYFKSRAPQIAKLEKDLGASWPKVER